MTLYPCAIIKIIVQEYAAGHEINIAMCYSYALTNFAGTFLE